MRSKQRIFPERFISLRSNQVSEQRRRTRLEARLKQECRTAVSCEFRRRTNPQTNHRCLHFVAGKTLGRITTSPNLTLPPVNCKSLANGNSKIMWFIEGSDDKRGDKVLDSFNVKSFPYDPNSPNEKRYISGLGRCEKRTSGSSVKRKNAFFHVLTSYSAST
jgi:hypothetical protein